MSEDSVADASRCCASCGIAEVDEVKLKECDACDLVQYCSDACQGDHKSYHEEACKKRAAELRDELLFKQPESSHRGDCPICCLPLPLDPTKSSFYSCCSKLICKGCSHANMEREAEGRLKHRCPFCRKPTPSTMDEVDKRRMKRIEAHDPFAICEWGREKYKKGDYNSAFKYFTKAAELGDVDARFKLALLYHAGEGVEMNSEKKVHHLEEAAIGGHPDARYTLAVHVWNNDNFGRAVKHFTISANQGCDDSIKALMKIFKSGMISKDDLAAALRTHQAAIDATKSPQRVAADI